MKLIKITSNYVGQKEISSVSARDLHEGLKSKRDFSNWIHDKISYGFEYGIDFTTVLLKSSGGRPMKEYWISLDMAKEISMLERNDQGKKYRKYFLDCEKKLLEKQYQHQIPKTYSETLQLAADQAKEIERLEHQKQLDAPKVEFADKVEESTDTITMSEYAKIVNWGPNKLRVQLRHHRILMEEPRKNQPFQKFINSGYFKTTEKVNDLSGRLYIVTLITGKGQIWLSKRIESWI